MRKMADITVGGLRFGMSRTMKAQAVWLISTFVPQIRNQSGPEFMRHILGLTQVEGVADDYVRA